MNRIVDSSVNREFLDENLESNRVLMVLLGHGKDFWSVKKVVNAYFILEDNMNMDLKRSIIIQSNGDGYGEYSLREITN